MKVKDIHKIDNIYSIVGIAYFNMGAELEFLQKYKDAIETYEKGLKIAKTKLNIKHPIIQSLLFGISEGKKRLEKLVNFHEKRSRARQKNTIYRYLTKRETKKERNSNQKKHTEYIQHMQPRKSVTHIRLKSSDKSSVSNTEVEKKKEQVKMFIQGLVKYSYKNLLL